MLSFRWCESFHPCPVDLDVEKQAGGCERGCLCWRQLGESEIKHFLCLRERLVALPDNRRGVAQWKNAPLRPLQPIGAQMNVGYPRAEPL
jgi:hypothetical protein